MGLDFPDALGYLEQTRAVRTLLVLAEEEPAGLEQTLDRIGGSRSTGMSRINELVELGLAEKTVAANEPRKVFYRLTPVGAEVVEKLREAIEAFQDVSRE